MTKAAFITDTHIGLNFKDERIHKVLDAFADDMKELRPTFIFHLGDVFHTKRPAADAIEFATSWFTKLANCTESVIVLAGGHDADARMGFTAIDFLDDLSPKIKINTVPQSLGMGGMLLMPYIRRLEQEHLDLINQHSVLFMHQGIAEVPLDSSNRKYGVVPDAVPLAALQNLDLCLCGHIHTPWSSGNVHCIGSPYPTRRGMYSEDRSYPMLDLDNLEDMRWFEYGGTFRLKHIKVEYNPEEEDKLQGSLLEQLPPVEDDTFYSIDVAVTGPVSQKLYLNIKSVVESVYKKGLDDLAVVSVLPSDQRDIIQYLKTSTLQGRNAASPVAMLEAWMDEKRRKAYFDANPRLRQRMTLTLGDIVSTISGTLDGAVD